MRSVRLHPAADEATNLVDLTAGMLIPPRVQEAKVVGEPVEQSELLQAEVGRRERGTALSRVRRFDEALEHIERRRLHPVAEQKLLAARELLDRRDQPEDEPVHRLEGGARLASWVLRWSHARFLPLDAPAFIGAFGCANRALRQFETPDSKRGKGDMIKD